ncbi:hypothetical protein ASD24_20415 [Paenibacillus sp. Root52]|nr:hypothetical protein ASD24_20415 [Paenibacillus sp. Root52]
MEVLLGIIVQVLFLILFLSFMSVRTMNIRFCGLLLVGGTMIGMMLFPWIGASAIFGVVIYFYACLHWKTKDMLWSIIFPVISVLVSVLGEYLFGLIKINMFHHSMNANTSSLMLTVVNLIGSGLLSMTMLLTGLYFVKRFRGKLILKRYSVLFSVVCIFTLIIFYINIWIGERQGFSDDNIQANSILFLFYFALLIGVFVILSRTVRREAAMQNQREQYEQLTEYTENLEHLYTDMQKFRHDYINILLSMSEYIRHKNMDQLQAYFEHKIMPISQGMQSNTYKLGALHLLKVQELKGIISAKMIKAQELNIDAIIEVAEPIERIHMDAVPLCRCVGILLDNAIEEAIHCEAPTVHMALIRQELGTLIVVSNSCREETPELYQLFEKGFSTKGNNRGLGLNNLREMVAQYKGVVLDTQRRESTFIQLLEVFEN